MNNKYYVGIDGGGTYTKAVVVSSDGELLFREEGETINFNAVGFDAARENLECLFDKITENFSIDGIARVFIGCSALDSKAEENITKKLIGKYSALCVDMDSDLYVALYGHSFGKKGAMIISGTGSMGIAVSDEGSIHTCGGWGYAIGDEGSAYHIAVEGLRAATRMADGRAEKTALYYAMMKYYGITDPYALAEKIYQPMLSRNKVASFAKVVSECADNGDPTAKEILINAAKELALLASALMHSSGVSDRLAIYGGVLQHNKLIRHTLTDILIKEFPKIKVSAPKALPEFGAVAAAMNADGILTDQMITKLCEYK